MDSSGIDSCSSALETPSPKARRSLGVALKGSLPEAKHGKINYGSQVEEDVGFIDVTNINDGSGGLAKSKTNEYRKVLKPMLERKRRARMNQHLDELKDLVVTSLQARGECISKLEKADVLELTVRHLKELKQSGELDRQQTQNNEKYLFDSGYFACVGEVSKFLESCGVQPAVRSALLMHLTGKQPPGSPAPVLPRPYYSGFCLMPKVVTGTPSPPVAVAGHPGFHAGHPALFKSRVEEKENLGPFGGEGQVNNQQQQQQQPPSAPVWQPWC